MGALYNTVSSATNTTSTTTPMWTATTGGTKRMGLVGLTIGTDIAPADQASDFVLRRTSARGTSSGTFTPIQLDLADGAALFTFDISWSVAPTITAASDQQPIPVNQRALAILNFGGRGILVPITAGAGLALMAVATTAAAAYRFGTTWEE